MIATIPIGQVPQAIAYVPNAVLQGGGTRGLHPLDVAGQVAHLTLVGTARDAANASTSVALFNQGLVQVLQAAVTGLLPRHAYVLALSNRADGKGPLEPFAAFMTNPAAAAIVNAVGPIRQVVQHSNESERRYLLIVSGTPSQLGSVVQLQSP